MELGKVRMHIEPISIKEAVDSALDLMLVQAKEKNVRLEAKAVKDRAFVAADKSQIERVLINLIGNAIKFTPPGGKITVAVEDRGDVFQVNVSDTGIGIEKENLEKVFNEFYRVDNPINQKARGAGLGLSLVKRIIEAHGGEIRAESQLKKGTTFKFTLPKPKQ
jgi:signal transduction histidine kinase